MTIKAWDYIEEYKQEREEILSAIEEVLESGRLILGSKVETFEKTYAQYCGTKFGIGVANGTDAIFLALKSLGIGNNDEVITVSNTAIPTVSAIVSTGAKPVFVDITEDTYLMDVSKIEAAITPKTKCILPVHLFGQCADMDKINEIANRHNLYVIEDCAQSHGATYKNKKAGCMSHVSTTSFYPTKILSTFGDGGMINTNDSQLDKKLRRLRFYGAEKNYYALEHGYNSRLDELHASILLKKMNHLNANIERRRQIATQYNQGLKNSGLVLPTEAKYGNHAYHLYVVRHANRDHILRELKKQNIHLGINYPWPIHTMSGYAFLGYNEGDLPVTEMLAKQIFSLPMYPSLSDQTQEKFINILKELC